MCIIVVRIHRYLVIDANNMRYELYTLHSLIFVLSRDFHGTEAYHAMKKEMGLIDWDRDALA